MPQILSRYFGTLEYSPESAFEFPAGIPGFEEHSTFVFLELPHTRPLIFMQSTRDPGLCFITVPVRVADPQYKLDLSVEDRNSLGLPYEGAINIGEDVLCLAVVTVVEGADPTANLASPIALGRRSRIGLQAIQVSTEYSIRHPLMARAEMMPCS
jgi:flagellar assembly factor FliW